MKGVTVTVRDKEKNQENPLRKPKDSTNPKTNPPVPMEKS